jgi:hypothetical protein
VIDELKSSQIQAKESHDGSRYEGENSSEEIHVEILANYKDREKQVDELLNKDEVTDRRITEAGQWMASQNIYCSLPKNISPEYQPFGAYFPWEPGDHKPKITAQKYRLREVYFLWDPGGTELHACIQFTSVGQS